MKRALAGLLVLGCLTAPALAAPVSTGQKADFYKTCMAIAQNDRLCSCKADAAAKLVDAQFFGLVISAMRGKAPPASANVAYNNYIARSNQICKPGY
jgi:hypothetical protein